MTKLDRLISELCPDGVEVVHLEDCCEIEDNKRYPIKASERVIGKTPYYGANNIQDYVDGFTHDGEYVLIAEDGSSSLENYSIQYVTGQFWANNHVHVLKGKKEVVTRFLYHYFTAFNFVPFLVGGTRAKLNKSDMSKIPIFLPPLPIQSEIVRILDNFTELTARKKQYEYYRSQLFMNSCAQKVSMSEISLSSSTGVTPLAGNSDYYDGGTIPWLRTQEVRFVDIWDTEMRITEKALKETSLKWVPADCVIMAISGATAGRVGINKIPVTTNQHCCCFQINPEKAMYRYVFHYLSNANDEILQLKQGARGDLNAGMLRRFTVPLPSLEEQARIVAILDRFDALINDLTSGLPAEIEARRKQYEYYRDKLLTFDEKIS